MPWFRLDDSFHSHRKVLAAGNEAVGLFVRCGTYAAQHLTDGFVPEDVVLLYGSRELADTLVRAKLWRRTRGGWQIHDYLKYNPTREAVENDRKAAAERQKRRRDTMLSRRDSDRDSQRDTGVSHTTPTRPDPYIGVAAVTDPARRAPPREPNRYSSQQVNPGEGAAARHPSARPLRQALADAGVNGKPADGDTIARLAAAVRQSLTKPEDT